VSQAKGTAVARLRRFWVVLADHLFGPIFIIFAAPMAIVIFAAVNLLYVHDTLGEETAITRILE
jgi:hypothetical protein